MHTLYTLGYQGLKQEHLQEWVRRLDAFLVDIRFSPRSRHPAFSRAGLTRVFGDRYRHLPALGNRNYKGAGPVVLDNPGLGGAQVKPMLEERPVILMCVCWNLSECHRRVAADLIAAQTGVNLEHLGGRPSRTSL